MSLAGLTLHEAHQKLCRREISSRELTEAVLRRARAAEDLLHAYISLDPDSAMRQAAVADERLRQDPSCSPVCGIPIALKDNILARGAPTTCGSKILRDFAAPYDSTVAAKLRSAGAVLIGKTNLDEFAMGSSTENSAWFPTRNPWNRERVPGGSSGGSAAAVAADLCIAALGTDTGGSIRQPASYCGVVGLKPTYGRVSRYGIVAFASSMDQVGPITKDVRDCALLLEAVAGHDRADSTAINRPVPAYAGSLDAEIKGMRLGIPKEYFVAGMQPDVEAALRAAVRLLKEQGAVAVDISLPHTEYAVAVYYIVATAEASSNLARYDGMRFGYRARADDLNETYRLTREAGFGAEVKRRILLGTYALSAGYYDAYYRKAQQVRRLIKRELDDAFKRCDAIITPTAPSTAFRLGEKTDDPLQMYLSDIYTISVNLAGLPALSVPCGFDRESLPIGMQIIGGPFDEERLLRLAYRYQQCTAWHLQRPPVPS